MPAALKKRPLMESEPGEGKAHEMKESPEEEVREGSESEESEYPAKRGRKRSSRGAKRTKAPMDAEGGCCGEKKGHGKCSACASGKPCGGTMDASCGMQRGDSALTPQEYLAACDLGIQDRSRPYIRTRLTVMDSLTPSTVQLRTDKKCGGSAIPDNKQCRVGGGGGAGAAPRKMSTGKRVLSGALAGLSAYSAVENASRAVRSARRGQASAAFVQGSNALGQGLAARQYFKGNIRKGLASEVAGYGLAAGGLALSKAARTPGAQNAARRAGAAAGSVYARARNAVRRAPTVSGQSMGSSTPGRRRASVGQQAYRVAKGASYAAGRTAGSVASLGRRRSRAVPYGTGGALRRRGDADVWAVGFEPRTDKKCGGSGIADNKQCRAGAGGATAPGRRTLTGPNGQFSRQRIAREGWYGSQAGSKPFSYKSNAKRGAAINAVAGAVYGGALGGLMGGTRGAVRGALAGGAFGGAVGAGAGAAAAGVNRATSRAAQRSLARRPAR